VALTSYEFLMAKRDRPRLAALAWSHVIIDEGHRLKSADCKLAAELRHYRARSRLLLTGERRRCAALARCCMPLPMLAPLRLAVGLPGSGDSLISDESTICSFLNPLIPPNPSNAHTL